MPIQESEPPPPAGEPERRERRRGGSDSAAPLFVPTVLAVLIVAATCCGIGSHGLWTPDEPTGAAVGKAMFASGDLVVPRLNGRPFLEKPPLYWWAQVAGFRLLGVSDATARLPSAVFGLLALCVTWCIGWRVGGARLGWLAAAVLAATSEFNEDVGRVVVDPALVFSVALCHLGFVLMVVPKKRGARWGALLVVAALPLAFLAKGVVGLGLGAAPPALYLLAWSGPARGRVLRRLAGIAAASLVLLALTAGPWLLALAYRAGPGAVRECLVGNTVGRFTANEAGRAYGHRLPFWYYFVSGPVALLPWSLAFPALLGALLLRRPGGEADLAALNMLGATFLIGVLLLSLAASKRTLYLLPLLPALSVCVAWWLDGRRLAGGPESLPAAKEAGRREEAQAHRPAAAAAMEGEPGGDGRGREALAETAREVRGRRAWRQAVRHVLARLASPAWDRGTRAALLALAALLFLLAGGVIAALRWAPLGTIGRTTLASGATETPGTGAAAVLATTSAPVGLASHTGGHRPARAGAPWLAVLRAELAPLPLAAALALTFGCGALLVVLCLRSLPRKSASGPPLRAALITPFLVLLLLYQVAAKRFIDPVKSLHDLTAALARLDPVPVTQLAGAAASRGAAPLAAYRPSESLLAIVNFDLGRTVLVARTPEDLAHLLAQRSAGHLLLDLASFRALPPPLAGRLQIVYDETSRKASPFLIAAWGPPARATPGASRPAN